MIFKPPGNIFIKKACGVIAIWLLFILQPAEITLAQSKIDSLRTSLNELSDNTAKVDVLNELCLLYAEKSPETAFIYCRQAAALADSLNYRDGVAKNLTYSAAISYFRKSYGLALADYRKALALYTSIGDQSGMVFCLRGISEMCDELQDDSCSLTNLNKSVLLNQSLNAKNEEAEDYVRIAMIYNRKSNYSETLNYYNKALRLKTDLGMKQDAAAIHNNIGILYRKQGEFDKALESYLKSLKLKEEQQDLKGMRSSRNNIGALYWYLKDYAEALKFYQAAMDISEKLHDDFGVAMSKSNIADVYRKTGKEDLALQLYLQSLEILEKLDAQTEVATVLTNIADMHLKKGSFKESLNLHQKALDIRRKFGMGEAIASSMNNIGAVYFAMGSYDMAIDYCQRSAYKADSIGAIQVLTEAYKNLSEAYSMYGQPQNELKYFKLYTMTKETIDNYETNKKINQLASDYEKPISVSNNGNSPVAMKGVKPVAPNFSENEIKLGEYYALLLAVQDYNPNSGITDLKYPINDASELTDILTSSYGFKKEHITQISNPRLLEVTAALESISDSISPEDNLIIFYAGHGFWDEKFQRGYWFPQDATLDNRGSWFSNTELQDYLRAIKSKHTLLIADACFAGSLFSMSREVAMEDASKSVHYKYKLCSRQAITSGTMETVPDASVFMRYLVKQLKENDEKYLPVGELFHYLQNAVANNSDNLPQYGVIRDTGHEGGDFIFIKRE